MRVYCVKINHLTIQQYTLFSDEYVTPEGKFDITLLGVSRFDSTEKKVIKEYITNENEQYSSAKSPVGMFEDLKIPNDLGLVVDKVNEYYGI